MFDSIFQDNTVKINGYRYDSKKVEILNKLSEIAQNLLCKYINQAPQKSNKQLPDLSHFIKMTILESNTTLPTLLVAIVYLQRFGSKLPGGRVNGSYDSCHRVFLACLMVSSKFVNDVTYRNNYWGSLWPEFFNLTDVNSMERELLQLFAFKLVFSKEEIDSIIREHFSDQKDFTKDLLVPQSWYSSVSV